MGRPAKFDDLRAKRAVDAVRAGLSRTAVAAKAGVHRATLMDWLARGRDGEKPYVDFLDRVRTAEAEAEADMVDCVRSAAITDAKHWQAAAWWLERSRPNDWQKREPTPDAEVERSESVESDVEVARSVLAALESKRAS